MSIEAGTILRETREQKGVSIKEASDALHIRIPYLQALENGRAEIIPSVVQARGFLRIYAEYLNISAADIIQEWDKPGSTALSAKPESTPPAPEPVSQPEAPARQDYPAATPAAAPYPESRPAPAPGGMPYPGIQGMPQNTAQQNPNFRQPQGYPPQAQQVPLQAQQIPPQPIPVQYTEVPPVTEAAPADLPEEEAGGKKKKQKSGKGGLFGKKQPKDTKPAEPKEDAQDLFDSIGRELAVRRKFLGLSLEDCESQTLIRSIYLESMENGSFEQLPSLIQARGMLNNYASFLDLDVDDIMLKFATALQILSNRKNKRDENKKHKPTKKSGKLKKFFTPDLFVGIFVIVGIAGIIIYSAITITAYRRNIAVPTPDLGISLLEQFLDTTRTPEFLPTSSPTPQPASQANTDFVVNEEEEETESEELAVSSQPVQLFINANQRALMKVIADGKEVFSGRTIPNNTYPFDAENEIQLTVSNGDAVSVVYNQQNLGRLGSIGQVVSINFSPSMAATPTPQFSPTPTNTYEPTYTPQPETPLPTNTPTPYIP